jgi:hypothetical protein
MERKLESFIVDKQSPKPAYFDSSQELITLTHLFRLDGSVIVATEDGDALEILSAPDVGISYTSTELFYDEPNGIVQYVFHIDEEHAVTETFFFKHNPAKVKITISGSIPNAATLVLPISTATPRPLSGEAIASTSVAFDWADIHQNSQGYSNVRWIKGALHIDVEQNFTIDPSTIASGGVIGPPQTRKTFYYDDKYWVFYRNASGYLCWKTSSDNGSTWSSEQTWGTTVIGSHFDCYQTGGVLSIAYEYDSFYSSYLGGDLPKYVMYRKGTLNSDSTITWATPSTIKSYAQGADYEFWPTRPTVTRDGSGNVFVGYAYTYAYYPSYSITSYEYLVYGSATDGTIGTLSGEYTVGETVEHYYAFAMLFPVNSNTAAIIYCASPYGYLAGRMLTRGSSLTAPQVLSAATYPANSPYFYFSAVKSGDNIHVFYMATYSSYNKLLTASYAATGSGSWTGPAPICDVTAVTYTVASSVDFDSNLYVFYTDNAPTRYLYRIRKIAGSWAASGTIIVDETTNYVNYAGQISALESGTAQIGVAYKDNANNLRFYNNQVLTAASKALSSSIALRRSSNKQLSANIVIRNKGANLASNIIIRNHGSKSLSSSINPGFTYTATDILTVIRLLPQSSALSSSLTVRKSAGNSLSSIVAIGYWSGAKDLSSSIGVNQENGQANLSSSCYVAQITNVKLPNSTIYRREPTVSGRTNSPTDTTLTVAMPFIPLSGDTIVAVLGLESPNSFQLNFNQPALTWEAKGGWGGIYGDKYVGTMIYVGRVGANASRTLTIDFVEPIGHAAVIYMVEYSATILNVVAGGYTTGNAPTTSTGSAIGTPYYSLCVGGVTVADYAYWQMSPTNGFTLFSASKPPPALSVAYLEKVAGGTVISGTTAPGTSAFYAGAMVAFGPTTEKTKALSGSITIRKSATHAVHSSCSIARPAKLPSSVTIRHPGSVNLSSSVKVGWKETSRSLSGSVCVRNVSAKTQSCNATLRKPSSKSLSGSLSIQRSAYSQLSANLYLRHGNYYQLPSSVTIRKTGSKALSGNINVVHHRDLSDSISIQRTSSKTLSSSITLVIPSSVDLRTNIHIRKTSSTALHGSLTPRYRGSKNLSANVSVSRRRSKALSSSVTVRTRGSKNLSSSLTIRRSSSADLSENIWIREHDAADYSGAIMVRNRAAINYRCSITVRGRGSKALSDRITLYRPTHKRLSGSVTLRKASAAALPCNLSVGHPASNGLSGSLTIRKQGSYAHPSSITIRNCGVINYRCSITIQGAGQINVPGSVTLTQPTHARLSGSVTIRKHDSADLYSTLYIGYPGSKDLSGSITVRRPAAAAASASVTLRKQGSSRSYNWSITLRKPDSSDLSGSITLRKASAAALSSNIVVSRGADAHSSVTLRKAAAAVQHKCTVTIRKAAAADLSCSIRLHRPYADLSAFTTIQRPGYARVRGSCTCRNRAAADLSSSIGVSHYNNLSSSITVSPNTELGGIDVTGEPNVQAYLSVAPIRVKSTATSRIIANLSSFSKVTSVSNAIPTNKAVIVEPTFDPAEFCSAEVSTHSRIKVVLSTFEGDAGA